MDRRPSSTQSGASSGAMQPTPSPSPAPSVASTSSSATRRHSTTLTPAELTRSLDEVLHLEKCYETPDGLRTRREVLNNLNVLVKQWIQVRLKSS